MAGRVILLWLACAPETSAPPAEETPFPAEETPTPPSPADTDGDGLTDEEERTLGTDPSSPDSDGDTYADPDELQAGTDPLDAESRIYTGYWPYNPEKDALLDPGWDVVPDVGVRVPRFQAVDQFGELVDLYDFGGQDRPVVLDLSAAWCGPCQDMARWLGGEADAFDPDGRWRGVPERVQAGDVYWITVVFADAIGLPATPAEAASWAETFPNAVVPVLADEEQLLSDWVYPASLPCLLLVDDEMVLQVFTQSGYEETLDAVSPP